MCPFPHISPAPAVMGGAASNASKGSKAKGQVRGSKRYEALAWILGGWLWTISLLQQERAREQPSHRSYKIQYGSLTDAQHPAIRLRSYQSSDRKPNLCPNHNPQRKTPPQPRAVQTRLASQSRLDKGRRRCPSQLSFSVQWCMCHHGIQSSADDAGGSPRA